MAEFRRVLEPDGVLVWVDAPYLYPRDAWSRFLDWLFVTTGGCADAESQEVVATLQRVHGGALWRMFAWQVHVVKLERSEIGVFVGVKQSTIDLSARGPHAAPGLENTSRK